MNAGRQEDRAAASNVIGALAPPHSAECEQALISCVLADETGGAVSIAQQVGVRASAFHSSPNGTVWETIEALAARRVPLTAEALVVELQATGKIDEAGGLAHLMQATGGLLPTAHTRHYAEELVLLWQRRHALTLAAKLRENALNFTERNDFMIHCDELGRKLVGLGRKVETVTMTERINAVLADEEARATGKEDRSGWIYTGLKTFDERLRPLNSSREDQLTVVAGGSGDGKSALLRQFANSALNQKLRVLMFTRETTVDGCIEQMAATAAGYDLMNPDRVLPEVRRAYRQYCERMRDEWANKYLFCHEHSSNSPLLTIEDLVARARQHCFLHGEPHLTIVDYLQLLTTKKRMQSREQEVAHVSHELQGLSGEIGGAWGVACQMNEKGLAEMRALRRERGNDGKEGKVIHRIPNAGDLRESQAIYHDAHRVIALYRPPVDSRDQDQTGPNIDKPEQWLCQIKRKRGRTGIVKCWFEKTYTRFTELPNFTHGAAGGPVSAPTKQQWRGEHGGAK